MLRNRIRRFFSVFTRTYRRTLSWSRWLHFTRPHIISLRSILTLILPPSRTGTAWFYTSTSTKRAARPKLYTKSLTRDLKLMYSRFTLVRISINLNSSRGVCITPQAVTHSLVLLKMGKIISRNMLSWLELRLMEILSSVKRLYISFKSLVNDFVYSFWCSQMWATGPTSLLNTLKIHLPKSQR